MAPKGKSAAADIASLRSELARSKRLRDAHDDKVADLEAQLSALTTPAEPETWPNKVGAQPVIRFKKVFDYDPRVHHFYNGDEYSYAAMGWKGYWYLTQNRDIHRRMTWKELLTFIGKDRWDTIEVLG